MKLNEKIVKISIATPKVAKDYKRNAWNHQKLQNSSDVQKNPQKLLNFHKPC